MTAYSTISSFGESIDSIKRLSKGKTPRIGK